MRLTSDQRPSMPEARILSAHLSRTGAMCAMESCETEAEGGLAEALLDAIVELELEPQLRFHRLQTTEQPSSETCALAN
eukprot:2873054-Rhodomonas_salina.1